jgi:hypothetical protein
MIQTSRLCLSASIFLALISLMAVDLVGGDAPVQVSQPEKADSKSSAKKVGPFDQLAIEEKWIFEPSDQRQDIFYDLEAMLANQLGETGSGQKQDPTKPVPADEIEALREWAKGELSRAESFIFERKWDEAIKVTEAGIKKLQPRVGDDSIIFQITDKMKRYKVQAEEAKIFEEAQSKFDALGLRVEGILWSPAGSLAVISGEPRARAINERVKDCVIINIDTNRVDFLFHYNRRRFEFQRYVGEDATSKKPGQSK